MRCRFGNEQRMQKAMSHEPRTDLLELESPNRRNALRAVSLAGLSATGLALLAGCQTSQAQGGDGAMTAKQDVDTLNLALGLEHEAIGAYGIAGGSGLLQPAVLDTALLFKGHHEGHRDALAATITKMGGAPVEPKSTDYYMERIDADKLKSQADILALALKLEGIAANAYLSVIPKFANTDLSQVAGRIACDEVMHWTVLQTAMGHMIPKAPLTFGA